MGVPPGSRKVLTAWPWARKRSASSETCVDLPLPSVPSNEMNKPRMKKIRTPRANCKTPAVCSFQSSFPLTLTLSLRERENQCPPCDHAKRLGLSNARPMMLPLPEGEGRGEGEQSVRIPERCDFCNRLPKSEKQRDSRNASALRLFNLDQETHLDFLGNSVFGLRISHEALTN